jgi:hypothetical protein
LANNSDSYEANKRYSAKSIRTAFESLAPKLGKSNVDRLIIGLEAFGLQLSNDENSYTIAEIKQALDDLFSDAAPLIFESLKEALKSE